MGNIDSFLGSSLSSLQNLNKKLTDGDDKEKSDENMKKIVEYLYTLTEQLRYMFNNIDEENLTDKAMVRVIEDATEGKFTEVQQTSDAITAIIAGLNEAQKAVRVVFDSTGLTIKNGGFKIVDTEDNTTMSVSNSGNVSIVGAYETETWISGTYDFLSKFWSTWNGTSLEFHTWYDGSDEEIEAYFGKRGYSYDCLLSTPEFKLNPYYSMSGTINSNNPRIHMFTADNGFGAFRLGNYQYNAAKLEVDSYGAYLSINNKTGTAKWTTGVNSSGNGYSSQQSSKRYKYDIEPMKAERAEKLLNMEFSSFKYNDGDGTPCYGLIAEDIAELGLDDIVMYDDEQRPDAIDYTKLIPYMGKLIQDINTRLERLEKAS